MVQNFWPEQHRGMHRCCRPSPDADSQAVALLLPYKDLTRCMRMVLERDNPATCRAPEQVQSMEAMVSGWLACVVFYLLFSLCKFSRDTRLE